MEMPEACGNNNTRTAGILLPRCHFCGQVPEKGIRGGIRIRKAFICERCEAHIVSLQAGCSEYRYLLEELKKIW
ncbi:sigma factor G inhibitor Gin [Syntrophomonas curvata]